MLRKSSSGAGSKVLPRHLSKPHTGSLSSGSVKSWNIGCSPKNLSSLSSMGLTSHLAGAPGMDPEYVMQLVSDVRWFADVLLNLKEVFNRKGELKFRSVGGQSSGDIYLYIEFLGGKWNSIYNNRSATKRCVRPFFVVVEFDRIHENTAAPTATGSRSLSTGMCWGPAAGLAVGVSCLAIPLAGGGRPLWVSLGQLHAECCSEPLQKHLGYLLPSKQSFPYGSLTSFSSFPGFFLVPGDLFFFLRDCGSSVLGEHLRPSCYSPSTTVIFFLLWMLKLE